MPTEILEKTGKKVVLLGNEAIARGAIEAGVGMVACYPGTPSSEVPIALSSVAKKVGFYFEYSTNEKVAFETATGASWADIRSLSALKHYGLNVASDSVLPIAYLGVKGGLVLMVADDPQGWSSVQSEQDSRYFAKMGKIPMIEPTNPQECLDYTKLAFDISEEFELPIFLRTTTKTSHSIGTVKLGKIKKLKDKGFFKKDPARFNTIKRPNLQIFHKKLIKKLEGIEKKYSSKLNKVFPGNGEIGIITSGVSFEYIKEALQMLGFDLPIAKIGLTFPLSKKFISDFIKDKKKIIVVEELEPILEDFVKIISKDVNPGLIVHGKDVFSVVGEYNLETIFPGLEKVLGRKIGIDFNKHKKNVNKVLKDLPPRKPVFCPGCPHRSTFYAVEKVFGKNTVYSGDIGCYALGIFEPFKMQDFIVSMGSSLGIGHGISKVSDQDVVVFIGDSTFFHAGMAGLVNLTFNNGKSPLVIVMDNSITAMTGHQPNPGSGITGMGEKVKPVKIEDVAKSLGAEVRVANSFNQKQLIQTLTELKKMKGPRVLVSKGECRLLTKRLMHKRGSKLPVFEIVDQNKFKKNADNVLNKFSCPAIIKEKEKGKATYKIDPNMCWGCSVCMQISPEGSIKPKRDDK